MDEVSGERLYRIARRWLHRDRFRIRQWRRGDTQGQTRDFFDNLLVRFTNKGAVDEQRSLFKPDATLVFAERYGGDRAAREDYELQQSPPTNRDLVLTAIRR